MSGERPSAAPPDRPCAALADRLPAALAEILADPIDHGPLELADPPPGAREPGTREAGVREPGAREPGAWLVNPRRNVRYPILEGVPILVPEAASPLP